MCSFQSISWLCCALGRVQEYKRKCSGDVISIDTRGDGHLQEERTTITPSIIMQGMILNLTIPH
jgi:hypothetical protein